MIESSVCMYTASVDHECTSTSHLLCIYCNPNISTNTLLAPSLLLISYILRICLRAYSKLWTTSRCKDHQRWPCLTHGSFTQTATLQMESHWPIQPSQSSINMGFHCLPGVYKGWLCLKGWWWFCCGGYCNTYEPTESKHNFCPKCWGIIFL